MITIHNVKNIYGEIQNLSFESPQDLAIDAAGLTALPALIDPHVHFRVPGGEHKEDWISGSCAAIAGGVTTVFDMPNNSPPCTRIESLYDKRRIIDGQLLEAGVPLRYHLYLGVEERYVEEIPLARGKVKALKVFMGSCSSDFLISESLVLERVFELASQHNLIVAVHAESNEILQRNSKAFCDSSDPSAHSRIHERSAAVEAVERVLAYAEKYGTKLYILHVSAKEEVELIRRAKFKGLSVFAEVAPHHLFLTEEAYKDLGNLVKMNPPLREERDRRALWDGLRDGSIDAVGTDHAPHDLSEKKRVYEKAPPGVPGIETALPLLLDAYNKGEISLQKIVAVTRRNVERFFSLEENDDLTLVDLQKVKKVEETDLKTKCSWSPFAGMELSGWPVYTIVRGKVFKVDAIGRKVESVIESKYLSGAI